MSNAIRWTPEMLAEYETRLGRPLKLAKAAPAEPAPKRHKYNAKKVTTDDGVFDSKREHARWEFLKQQLKLGVIRDLIRHPTFKLAPKVQQEGAARATPAIRYEADFMYVQDGKLVVEDAKGMKTRTYLMKKHLMLSLHNITIHEV